MGVFLENEHLIPGAFMLTLLNLPFLVILGPLLMMMEPFRTVWVPMGFVAWAIIFTQAYFAFIFLCRRAEADGASTFKALRSSVGRLVFVSLLTLVVGGLALVFLLRMP